MLQVPVIKMVFFKDERRTKTSKIGFTFQGSFYKTNFENIINIIGLHRTKRQNDCAPRMGSSIAVSMRKACILVVSIRVRAWLITVFADREYNGLVLRCCGSRIIEK